MWRHTSAVGAQGHRRRTPRRRLPKPGHPGDYDDPTPPVMWSPPGSGFQPSTFSPAGQSQRLWNAVRSWNSAPRDLRRRAISLTALAALIEIAIVTIVIIVGATLV